MTTASKAKAAADEHGINRWYGSYEDQLADPEIDAVIIPLPISMHCEWTVKAAEAGKHILCEKPLAASAKDCQRMIDAAHRNNVVLVDVLEAELKEATGKLRATGVRAAKALARLFIGSPRGVRFHLTQGKVRKPWRGDRA